MVSALDVPRFLFGESAAAIAPWFWGGLGVLVGVGIATVVMRRHRRPQRLIRLQRSGIRGFPRHPRD